MCRRRRAHDKVHELELSRGGCDLYRRGSLALAVKLREEVRLVPVERLEVDGGRQHCGQLRGGRRRRHLDRLTDVLLQRPKKQGIKI